MTKTERRFAEGVTVEGRTLTGTAMRYGDVATVAGQRERFEPGAFGKTQDAMLNLHHERSRPLARTGGGGLELTDNADALTLTATLPETRDAKDALALVKSGVLRGLSVEFRSKRERREAGVRVIERAELVAIGLVDTPAYDAATVSARHETQTGAADGPPWWTL